VHERGEGEVFAGYRIDALGGRGGMGMVYRAVHLRGERTVALKVISPELAADEGFRQRSCARPSWPRRSTTPSPFSPPLARGASPCFTASAPASRARNAELSASD
jgi:serine/threonine protein kinase